MLYRSAWLVLPVAAIAIAATSCAQGTAQKSAHPTAAPSTSAATITYSAEQVKTALLPPAQISKSTQLTKTGIDDLSRSTLPTCPKNPFKPASGNAIEIAQYADQSSPYAPRYARAAVLYPDQQSAAADFQRLADQAKKCPASGHVNGRKISEKKIALPYDFTWSPQVTATPKWQRISVTHEKVSKAAGRSDTISISIDYALRGNLLFTAIYWERLEPNANNKAATKHAAALIGEQLAKFG